MGNQNFLGFPGGASGEESACRCKRLEMWVPSLGQEDFQREKWQAIPVFLPGEFHRQRSLVCCSPWGYKAMSATEQLSTQRTESHGQKQIVQICQTGNSDTHSQTERAWLRTERSLENVTVSWNAKLGILEYIVSKKTTRSKQKQSGLTEHLTFLELCFCFKQKMLEIHSRQF